MRYFAGEMCTLGCVDPTWIMSPVHTPNDVRMVRNTPNKSAPYSFHVKSNMRETFILHAMFAAKDSVASQEEIDECFRLYLRFLGYTSIKF